MSKKNYINEVNVNTPSDYKQTEQTLAAIAAKFPFANRITIGKSYLGRNIDALKIGSGAKKTLFVGTHHGMEWITAALLLRFAEDLCKSAMFDEPMYGINAEFALEGRTAYIIPMLNPDGAELAINGIESAQLIRDRLIAMNGGSADFSHWQANARGVDLNHNYDAHWHKLREIEIKSGITEPCPTRYGGEYPESESETSALCSFVRMDGEISSLAALHTQGEVIYWRYGDSEPPRAPVLAKMLSQSTGYALEDPDEEIASCGGCKDWFISAFARPGFTIECGKGKNPLPLTDFIPIYSKVAPALMSMFING